ncbi:hypothetical protein MMC13_008145 [Lambiella insularis]|nr:hypothetical protein [Lambiella insularis]
MRRLLVLLIILYPCWSWALVVSDILNASDSIPLVRRNNGVQCHKNLFDLMCFSKNTQPFEDDCNKLYRELPNESPLQPQPFGGPGAYEWKKREPNCMTAVVLQLLRPGEMTTDLRSGTWSIIRDLVRQIIDNCVQTSAVGGYYHFESESYRFNVVLGLPPRLMFDDDAASTSSHPLSGQPPPSPPDSVAGRPRLPGVGSSASLANMQRLPGTGSSPALGNMGRLPGVGSSVSLSNVPFLPSLRVGSSAATGDTTIDCPPDQEMGRQYQSMALGGNTPPQRLAGSETLQGLRQDVRHSGQRVCDAWNWCWGHDCWTNDRLWARITMVVNIYAATMNAVGNTMNVAAAAQNLAALKLEHPNCGTDSPAIPPTGKQFTLHEQVGTGSVS